MMKTAAWIILLFGVACAGGRGIRYPMLRTVESVDLERYAGTWFEIAAFPQRFEKGCHCSSAVYELTDKGYVRVVNSCRKSGPEGKIKKVRGKAFLVPGSGNAKLRVQFFWPFRGDYWIIDLASDYSYALVGAPNRKYLWILSRTPEMDPSIYDAVVTRAGEQGFDTAKLVRMDQSCR